MSWRWRSKPIRATACSWRPGPSWKTSEGICWSEPRRCRQGQARPDAVKHHNRSKLAFGGFVTTYLRASSARSRPTTEHIVPDDLNLLKLRRSVKPREMSGPGPSADELDTILTIGARVPDHGKMTPWRFIVFEGDARARAGDVIAKVFAKKNPAAPAADIEIEKKRLNAAPLV